MNFRNALIVFRKELRDMLRDKRTIRSMIIIPVVAFPLLFLVISWAMVRFSDKASKEPSLIMVRGGDDSPKVLEALKSFEGIQVVGYRTNAHQLIADKKIQALVYLPTGFDETILTSPVARTDLVSGKFLMVVLASVVTAILSLISMGISFAWSKRSFLGATDVRQMTIDPGAIGAVIALLLPLAILFAAVLLAVALVAKSYREAQTYVSPLVFVVIIPALIGALPGVELNWKTALIPILNTCLVSKDVIAGNYHWGLIAAVFGVTCFYAAIGIAAAVRMFNREDVLFRV